MRYKKIMMLAMLLVSLIAISAASASENVTDNTISADDSANAIDLTDNVIKQEEGSETFQARIIPQGYDHEDDIPQQINYTTESDDHYGYYIEIVDENNHNIPDLKVRLVDANTDKEKKTFSYLEDEELYWCDISALGAGNHNCKIIADEYDIKPLNLNLEIVKSDVELVLKDTYVVKGDYATIKVKVTDMEGKAIRDNGKVKFTVNGKSYYRSIDKNGAAALKVKMDKQGTNTYSATFTGGKNHNPSSANKGKIHVLSNSKTARTISIKGYKVVIPMDKYKKLVNAKNTGKTLSYKLDTKKTIKQKVDVYNEKTGKWKTKTVKSKIYIYIYFDGSYQYKGLLPAKQYVARLTTSNQHETGKIICYKWLIGYKQSKEFSKLNSAKVRQKPSGL